MDRISPEKRSRNMSRIHGKDTKIEVLVRSWLFARGLRFQKNDNRYPGHPDVVLPKYRTVIFVNGCFWHMHEGCKYATTPKTRTDFWLKKFERNVANDKKNRTLLESNGWQVNTVWECELKEKRFEGTMQSVLDRIIKAGKART